MDVYDRRDATGRKSTFSDFLGNEARLLRRFPPGMGGRALPAVKNYGTACTESSFFGFSPTLPGKEEVVENSFARKRGEGKTESSTNNGED